jgi:hypothetical protein
MESWSAEEGEAVEVTGVTVFRMRSGPRGPRGRALLPLARGRALLPLAFGGALLPLARGRALLPLAFGRALLPLARGRALLPFGRAGRTPRLDAFLEPGGRLFPFLRREASSSSPLKLFATSAAFVLLPLLLLDMDLDFVPLAFGFPFLFATSAFGFLPLLLELDLVLVVGALVRSGKIGVMVRMPLPEHWGSP